jgi:hypothetical protein
VIPAASLLRTSRLPSLRSPVSAARTLCTCQPVALAKSLIAAPLGRWRRAIIAVFFDDRAGTGECPLGARDPGFADRFGAGDLADLRAVLRPALGVWVLWELRIV